MEEPKLDTREAIIAHLENLAVSDNEKLRNRDFSYLDGLTFEEPLPRFMFADEASGQQFNVAEGWYLGKTLCEAYPEYDSIIVDMVTALDDGDGSGDLKKITKAETFATYERTGIHPGITTTAVMIIRYTCKNGHWAITSYVRMPGGSMLDGAGL